VRLLNLVLLAALLALGAVAAQPPTSVEAFSGHGCTKATCVYFTSSKKQTGYYFERCDSTWRNVKRRFLQGYMTAQDLLVSFPKKTLRLDCNQGSPTPTTGAPVAHFYITLDQQTALFANTSTGAGNTYFWEFGDGYTSTAISPHHYYKPGDYVVSLTATNSKGTNTYTRPIDMGVTPEPTAPPVKGRGPVRYGAGVGVAVVSGAGLSSGFGVGGGGLVGLGSG
jgi:PKD repeat protein